VADSIRIASLSSFSKPKRKRAQATRVIAAKGTRAMLKQPLVALLVLTAFAIAAKALHHFMPGVPLPVLTLGFGVMLGNIVERSVEDAPRRLPFEIPLALGMILLGAQIDGGTIAMLGLGGVIALFSNWILVGLLYLLAVKCKLLPERKGALLATGMTGCGISAVIASAAGDPQSERSDVALGTAIVLACGALGLILLPLIGDTLQLDSETFARWVGVVMPTTAESVMAAARHSEDAFRTTGAYRLLVNLLLGLPVMLYLAHYAPKQERERSVVAGVTRALIGRMPPFVWGLALLAAVGVFGFFAPEERRALGNLTNWAFAVTLVGIGYQTRPVKLWRLGWRTILVCLCIWLLSAGIMLAGLVSL